MARQASVAGERPGGRSATGESSGSEGKASRVWVAPNIYFYQDAKRAKPYFWKQSIGGVRYAEFFEDLEGALGARASKLASVQKYGRLAHEFDKGAFMEYQGAKDLLPADVDLRDVAKEWMERRGARHAPGMTIERAYALFLESKAQGRRAAHKRPLSREHLSDLRWRGRLLVSRFGHLAPSAVTGAQLLALYAEPEQAGRTVLNKHNTLRIFFNWAKAQGFLARSPYEEVAADALPDRVAGAKHPLPLAAVAEMLAYFEARWPKYCGWLALRLFGGIRTAEAKRFRYDWIDLERRVVRLPGWTGLGAAATPGSKTRDDWALYDLPGNFWAWMEAYPAPPGRETFLWPHCKVWPDIRDGMIEAGILEGFGNNTFRDTFCTFLFSADPNPGRVAALMKHRNPDTMFRSYLGCLRPRWEGRAYMQLYPGAEALRRA